MVFQMSDNGALCVFSAVLFRRIWKISHANLQSRHSDSLMCVFCNPLKCCIHINGLSNNRLAEVSSYFFLSLCASIVPLFISSSCFSDSELRSDYEIKIKFPHTEQKYDQDTHTESDHPIFCFVYGLTKISLLILICKKYKCYLTADLNWPYT